MKIGFEYRYGRHQGNNQEFPSDQVDYMDVSPKQDCRSDGMYSSWKWRLNHVPSWC